MTTRCINSRSLSLSLTMYFLARTDSPGIGYRTVSRQQTDNCRNSCMNSLPAQAPLRCGVSYGPVSVCPSVWPPVQVGFLSKRIQGSSCCHRFWHGRSHQATPHCVLRRFGYSISKNKEILPSGTLSKNPDFLHISALLARRIMFFIAL